MSWGVVEALFSYLRWTSKRFPCWNQMAPLLASEFQVIAFDWPGMGYSDE
jgi:pimeloyl-ACP methyl ester carboxylesterase